MLDRDEEYILFSDSGFEKRLYQIDEEVKLFTIDDLKGVF